MKSALIIGSSGQDGILLSRLLKSKAYHVTGVSRTRAGDWCDEHIELDAQNASRLAGVVAERRPNEIYYLAAFHCSSQASSHGSNGSDALLTFDVNLNSYIAVLDVACRIDKNVRVFYACSSLIYGEPSGVAVTESTEPRPKCLYSIAKQSARLVSEYYRENKGLHVSVGILFNHESIYRKDEFLSKRIATGVRAVRDGQSSRLVVGDLAARCDWGYAGDYVEAMWRMLQAERGDTFVVATGELHQVREWVDVCCSLAQVSAETVVMEDRSLLTRQRPVISGDSRKLKSATGWTPTVGFQDLVKKVYRGEI